MNNSPKFQVDSDITLAKTPPPDFYTNPYYFNLTKEKVFSNSWHWLADTDSLKLSNQIIPINLYENFLDEPLLLTRDSSDKIHYLSNVCTHRASIIATHPTACKQLQCPYHGRRFSLDGKFISMPEFKQAKNFPTDADNLTQIPLSKWHKFLFANLSPTIDFDKWIEPIQNRIGWLPLDECFLDTSRSRDYLVRGNWMLYCENYLEGFHIPFVHPDLNQALDYSKYSNEIFEYSTLQIGISKGAEFTFDLPKTSPDFGKYIAGYYFWLFPNLMLNFYPWGISINIVKPINNSLTKVTFLTYVWNEKLINDGAGSNLEKGEREDENIVESVQKGMRSRFYKFGRYSPTQEPGVHHFHKLLFNNLFK